MTIYESKLAQTHVALTDPTRHQVLQLMMTILESKLAQTHVTLTSPTRQQVLQLMMTLLEKTCTDPCGPNWCDEAASTAADDDYMKANKAGFLRIQRHNRKIIKRILKVRLK